MSAVLLPVLTCLGVATVLWLTVRVLNRRERWAQGTLAVLVTLPLVYFASFGPACWFLNRTDVFPDDDLPMIYLPLGWLCQHSPRVEQVVLAYARLGMTGNESVLLPCGIRELISIQPDEAAGVRL